MNIAAKWWLARIVFTVTTLHLCAYWSGAAHGTPSGANARLISATDSRVVFEVDASAFDLKPSAKLQGTEALVIEGFGRTSEQGEPSVPQRRFLVGIPEGADFSLTWRVVRSEVLGSHRLEPGPYPFVRSDETGAPVVGEEFRIEDGVYDRGSSIIDVVAEPVARIRHQRVLPVRVTPVAYDPTTGETVIATLLQIEVSTGGAPQGSRETEGPRAPRRSSPSWERVLGRVLVNPDQSAAWRARSSVRPRRTAQTGAATEAVSGPLVKLLVRDTGLHRVSASTVSAKGFPAGVPLNDLRVFKRAYDPQTLSEAMTDVPHRVIENEASSNGVFDGADILIFYGQRLREDSTREDPLEKFSGTNVYWLGTSGGTPMAAVPVAAGFVSADTATAGFPVEEYYEGDYRFFDPTPPWEDEFYYYNSGYEASFSTTFNVRSIDPAEPFRLKARFLGGDRSNIRTLKLSIRNSHGATALNDVVVSGKSVVIDSTQTIPATFIDEGENTLHLAPTPERTTLEVLLDWFTIEYRARYRARGNALEFNSASLSGDTSVTVTGLSRTDVRLFDVTDALAPREYTLTSGHFKNTGNGYALSFRETFSSRKDYVVTRPAGIHEIPSNDVVADTPSALIGGAAEDGVDVLVVSHADFLGEMGRWVGLRRAQGYGVLMADVQDVYDEFNGGVTNPRAIKKFIQHFVDTGDASFVVLVGDASEDNRGVEGVAGQNYVPTESYTEYAAGGFDQDEVVTTDNWYAMLGTDFITEKVVITDYFPDVIIGRLPFGSVQEARDVVDKILKFEAPRGDDFWRRRMIRVADNPFSPGSSFGQLCYKPDEEGFALAEEEAAKTAEEAIPGGFDIVRFFLAEQLGEAEPPHDSGNCGSASTMAVATRDIASPALLRELNEGATVVSFQAHMHRGQICHEFLFDAAGIWGSRDHLSLTNTERPWIVFGMGCHMSDYAVWDEHSAEKLEDNYPNGDALTELMLLQKAGAVSTYASSGFEYLTPNVYFTKVISNAFFHNVPTDTMAAPEKAQARWILGELMTVAEIENLTINPTGGGGDGSVGQTKRFHLLGDPVLRIDGGPPRFDVTVNGEPFESGEDVSSVGSSGVIDVQAIITDEVAVEKVTLEIAGFDSTDITTQTRLKDENLDASRQYEVSFSHRLEAKKYDIILRAYQAEDTTAGSYHVVAEFVIKVEARAELTVNGRPVLDGDNVPPVGDYVFKVELPVPVPRDSIRVEVDGEPVSPLRFVPDDPAPSAAWQVGFDEELSEGPHEIVLFASAARFAFTLVVGTRPGVLDLIAYPNPFTDDVYFVFTNEVALSGGTVDVFTVSGKRVAHIDIPFHARAPGQNTVRWDGRTFDGAQVANGTYLYVLTVDQGGRKTTERGKVVRMK